MEELPGLEKIDAYFLLEKLKALHSPATGWQFFGELRLGPGYGPQVEKRVDAWAIQCWRSYRGSKRSTAPYLRRAFEIKVDGSDVLAELRNPDKRWMAYAISHEFYFVAPQGLIKPALLSKEDGLIEWLPEQGKLHVIKAPRVREAMPPKWSFVASLARRILEMENRERKNP